MKMTKKIFISGKIIAKTGLHIGGSSLGLSIGNTENTVVRNPITNQPYVPGSSIRGKMRSLLERLEGKFTIMEGSDIKNGPLTDKPDDIICKVFGIPAKEPKNEKEETKEEKSQPPTRLIVRDGNLVNVEELEKAQETDMPFTEVKTEVVIDRITSAAMPRQLERVPAGAIFDLDMVLNVWEDDPEKEMIDLLFKGLILMQNDYLGGHGGRGSGQVEIAVESLAEKTIEEYNSNAAPRERNDIAIPLELQNGELSQPSEAGHASN